MAELYSLSLTQLAVLLKGAGYSTLSGFDTETPVLDDSKVIHALHTLSRSGFITTEDDGFGMIPAMRIAAERIGNSNGFLTLRSGDARLPDRCVYSGSPLLVCTLRPTDRQHISLCLETAGELFEDLIDEGYLPRKSDERLYDEEELIAYEKTLFPSNGDSALQPDSRVLLSLDVLNADKQAAPYARIIDYYFYYYILYFDGTEVSRAPYSPSAFKEYYERMMAL